MNVAKQGRIGGGVRFCALLSCALVAVGLLRPAVAADPFLKVAVYGASQGATEQSGWNTLNWSQGNESGPKSIVCTAPTSCATLGRLSVVVASGTSIAGTAPMVGRIRTLSLDGTFPMEAVYKNIITGQSDIYVQIQGLVPGKVYVFKAYCYDTALDRTINVWRSVDGANVGTASQIAFTAATTFTAATDSDIYAATVTAMPDENDAVTFHLRAVSDQTCLNGFTLAEADEGLHNEFFCDFGGPKADLLQAGAEMFWFTGETAEDKSCSFANLLMNGSSGTVDVTLSIDDWSNANPRFIMRDRNGNGMSDYADYKYYNAYRDIIGISAGGNGKAMKVTIGGLMPETRFQLVLCPYDWTYGRTYVVTDWTTGTAGVSRTFTAEKEYAFTDETPDDALTAKMHVVSDADGRIIIQNAVASGECAISWLRLTYDPLLTRGLTVIIR